MARNYIPDLTERFPEGFDGVDMTSHYCNDLDDLRGFYKSYQEDQWHKFMEEERKNQNE